MDFYEHAKNCLTIKTAKPIETNNFNPVPTMKAKKEPIPT